MEGHEATLSDIGAALNALNDQPNIVVQDYRVTHDADNFAECRITIAQYDEGEQ